MKGKFILFYLILFTKLLLAQLNFSVESNNQYYVDDSKIKLTDKEAENRFRSNTYFNVTYKLNKFTFGAQLESYEPKALLNYSPEFKGVNLGTYYVNYNNEKGLDVTLGHFYEQFGSGLAFRTWEDRQLGIANSLVGGKVKYSSSDNLYTIKAIAGKQRIGFDFSDSFISGADLEFQLAKAFNSEKFTSNLGFSFVNRNQAKDNLLPNGATNVNVYGTRLNNEFKNFYLNLEYLYKSPDVIKMATNIDPANTFSGNAMNAVFGYSKKGLGFNANFRRLENFNFYSQRELTGNQYNQALLNYVPALTKQFDYSLANIYVYQAQPQLTFFPQKKSGEIGSQLDFYYQFKKGSKLGGKTGLNVALNLSNWYGLKSVFRVYEDYNTVKTKLFSLGERYYSDFNIDIRKKLNDNWNSAFVYLYQDYNKDRIEETSGRVYANTVAFDNTYKFNKKSLKVELQHQWANSSYKNWAAGLVEFNFHKNWSVFANDLYNYGNDVPEDRIHYYTSGVVFRKNSTRVQASYGRQRGGLLCVGGVCRMVPENTGFTLNINTTF